MGMSGRSGKRRPFIGFESYNEEMVFDFVRVCRLCVPVKSRLAKSRLANVPPRDSISEKMRTFSRKRWGSLDRWRRIAINMARKTRDTTTMIMTANASPAVSSVPGSFSSIMATVMGTALDVASVCGAGRTVVTSGD